MLTTRALCFKALSFNSDTYVYIGIAITSIAGPEGETEKNPIGTMDGLGR